MAERPSERRYRLIDHTADIGFELEAPTLKELFVRSAEALLSVIADLSKVEERVTYVVQADGFNREELLVAFLGEVLYLHDTEDLVFRRVEIHEGPNGGVIASLHGEKFDADRHSILRQIKAVTYHDIMVRERNGTWEARVILDI
ncbi:MAG: archease [Planctomycetota bacterium]|nr:archease [Planctomycetota bacterium]